MKVPILAQTSPEGAFWGFLPWFVGTLVAVVLAFVGLLYLRKLLWGNADDGELTTFNLEHLRTLRDRGELTIQEYEKLRREALRPFLQKSGGNRDESSDKTDQVASPDREEHPEQARAVEVQQAGTQDSAPERSS